MYMFTGIQRTSEGDTTIPLVECATKDEFLQKYHHEMDYAMSNPDFIGLTIKVYEKKTMGDVLLDTWYREPVEQNQEG